MKTRLLEIEPPEPGDWLAHAASSRHGAYLHTGGGQRGSRLSFLVLDPFLVFRSRGSHCEVSHPAGKTISGYGDPWRQLSWLLARFELPDEPDLPFPLGGAFGYWGYEMRHFTEPGLSRLAVHDSEMPDCRVGLHATLAVADADRGRAWILATGLAADGSRCPRRAEQALRDWQERLSRPPMPLPTAGGAPPVNVASNFSREQFVSGVQRVQNWIRRGDIYQVNLAQRFQVPAFCSGAELFHRLAIHSPAPYSAFLAGPEGEVASASPELFLRISGRHVLTRPIKGTRPRGSSPDEDARLAYELQASPKERAELVMITDLLRNDLGRMCEYGTVQVPELISLERFAQVQHLVASVEGRLRHEYSHLDALASCFPGGSITGAPKIRAMGIIDSLEPVTRGLYTGAHGFLGFNRESQLSISIRTAVREGNRILYHAGAGIVADSEPEAEYDETLAKARGFFAAVQADHRTSQIPSPRLP